MRDNIGRGTGDGSREVITPPSREPQRGEHSRPPSPVSRPQLFVCHLGTLPYADALDLQRSVARARIAGTLESDLLLLVEHPPVITLGRASKDAHLVASTAQLEARGVERFEVDRGGDVTFHGPGQLVGYPIFDLKQHKQDLHWYLRQLEKAIIQGVAPFGVTGSSSPGYTGVWVNDRKLASIGVHARDWVTWHGFALNVTTDMSWFDLIVPCGIAGVTMTSVAREIGEREVRSSDHSGDAAPHHPSPTARSSSVSDLPGLVRDAVVHGFESVFALSAVPLPYETLKASLPAPDADVEPATGVPSPARSRSA